MTSMNDNFVMYPTYLFFALGLLLIGFAHSGWMLLLAAIFIGLGYGSFSPFGQARKMRQPLKGEYYERKHP